VLALEEQARRRQAGQERQTAEAERRLRLLKEGAAALSAESVLAEAALDALRLQLLEGERAEDVRQRGAEEEAALAQQQAVLSIRASRSAVSGAELKRAELENLGLECRRAERRLEDLKRGSRELEASAEAVRESVKLLEAERARSRVSLAASLRDEQEMKAQLQALKLSVDSDSRGCEDARRRLLLLSEEEAALQDGEARLKASLAGIRKSIEESQVEIEDLRVTSERERRLLSELRGRKSLSEAEAGRAGGDASFAREQLAALERQQEEAGAGLSSLRAEAVQLQRELASSQRRTAEALGIEDQLRRLEKEAGQKNEKLATERDGVAARLSVERAQLECVRSERDRCSAELLSAQEALAAVAHEAASFGAGMESMKASYASLDGARTGLLQEMSQLRETARLEVSNIDRVNDIYAGAEKRLSEVRESLLASERSYEKAREQTAEEERRTGEQRAALRRAADEVRQTERQLAGAAEALHADRAHALAELGRLGAAKTVLQDSVIHLSDAQRRRLSAGDITIALPGQTQYSWPPTLSPPLRGGIVHVPPADRLRSHFSDAGSSSSSVPGWSLIESDGRGCTAATRSAEHGDVDRNQDPCYDDYSDDTFCSNANASSTDDSSSGSNDDGGSSDDNNKNKNLDFNRFEAHRNNILFSENTDELAGGGTQGWQGTAQGLVDQVRRLQEKSATVLQNR
jgi:chromosome segregation ATPase